MGKMKNLLHDLEELDLEKRQRVLEELCLTDVDYDVPKIVTPKQSTIGVK